MCITDTGAVFPTGGIGGRLGCHSEGGAQKNGRQFFLRPHLYLQTIFWRQCQPSTEQKTKKTLKLQAASNGSSLICAGRGSRRDAGPLRRGRRRAGLTWLGPWLVTSTTSLGQIRQSPVEPVGGALSLWTYVCIMCPYVKYRPRHVNSM